MYYLSPSQQPTLWRGWVLLCHCFIHEEKQTQALSFCKSGAGIKAQIVWAQSQCYSHVYHLCTFLPAHSSSWQQELQQELSLGYEWPESFWPVVSTVLCGLYREIMEWGGCVSKAGRHPSLKSCLVPNYNIGPEHTLRSPQALGVTLSPIL